MIFKSQPKFIQSLLALPESGMGYQIIDAKRQGSNLICRFIVYNCALIVEYGENFYLNQAFIAAHGYVAALNECNFIALKNPILVKPEPLKIANAVYKNSIDTQNTYLENIGAIDSEPICSNETDVFVRLSAYIDDRRIDFVEMKLKSGAFATTEADYINCKTGNYDPIDRYALPNDEAINWAFFIQPKIQDKYRLGIVQPVNNHNGGGIEAFFDNGTSKGTYIKKTIY